MFVFMFPSMSEQSEAINQYAEAFPEAMMEAFDFNENTFTTIEGFMSVEYYSLTWVLIIAIFIFALGGSVVAGEIDKKTSEFTYTLPLKRHKIALSKTIASIIMLTVLTLITFIINYISIQIIDETSSIEGNLKFISISISLSIFLLAITTLLSSFFRQKSKVYGIVAGFFILSYMLHIFANINETAEKIYFLSFFKYYGNPTEILLNESFSISNLLFFIVSSLILFGASLYIVERRDL